MDFTSDQKSAIAHVSGNLQLIACAGSGKTEVVARRVVTLLSPTTAKGGGCRPENIVAFTFTDKAAAELKERIHARCRESFGEVTGLAEMYIGTIHGFCLDGRFGRWRYALCAAENARQLRSLLEGHVGATA
jgi:DNA helicase II / ATP-dependent DNA helicase PcrA